MAYKNEYFESRDTEGTTTHFNGTVDTSAVSLPSSADTIISEFTLTNTNVDSDTKLLQVSLDSGSSWFTIYQGISLTWSPKGNVKQIQIRGSESSVAYQCLMNREVD